MGTSYHSVLQQLEDLRLAEWSDQAPPPPSHPGHRPTHTTTNSTHTYANYPSREEERRPRASSSQQSYNDSDPIYQPGQYAVTNNTINVLLPPAYLSYFTTIENRGYEFKIILTSYPLSHLQCKLKYKYLEPTQPKLNCII